MGHVVHVKTERVRQIPWFERARMVFEQALRRLSGHLPEAVTRTNVQQFVASKRAPVSCQQEATTNTGPVVLVPMDFSAASFKAAQFGIKLARDSQASLILIHAIHLNLAPYGPANPARLKAGLGCEAIEKAGPIMVRAREAGVNVTCVVEEGVPAAVIAKAAKRWKARAIILATTKRGRLARLFGNRITEKVIRGANCPVMVLETKEA
jgi:nucleotide-binding universal stress UspA family protein